MDRDISLQIVELLQDISEALVQIAENTTPAEDSGADDSGAGDGAGGDAT